MDLLEVNLNNEDNLGGNLGMSVLEKGNYSNGQECLPFITGLGDEGRL